MSKKKNEVATTTENAVIVGNAENPSWGTEDVGAEDIMIPRIMLMQAMSELVGEGLAAVGEYRDSLDRDKIIAPKDGSFGVIIFGTDKKIMRFINGEFDAIEDYTPDYKYDEADEAGNIIKRGLLMQFYCLLEEDIKNGEAFPYVLSFRSTATRVGKALATQLKKLQVHQKPSAARVFNIGTKKDTNVKGTWFVPTIQMGEVSTPEQQSEAYTWYKALMNNKNVKIDAGDVTSGDDDDSIASGATVPHAANTQVNSDTENLRV